MTGEKTVDLSVIIVTFNSADHIGACLESVQAQTGVAFEIIVVDNASADGTLEKIKGLKCRVIPSPENLGFGRGNNLGFASSRGRYIYLLNPDARLPGKNALADLCRKIDANPRWGMAGTRVLSASGKSESKPATIYPAQRHVHRDFSKLPGNIAWVLGASMIIRRELYEKLGGFDPGFFLYSEETDFCLRLRELGFEIGHITEVAVSHIGGASEDPRDPYATSSDKLRGLLRFRQKHYPPEDCIFLAKRDLRRAWFRMVWNGLLARLQPPHSRSWQKHRGYRGIWEVSRQFLSSAK
jgi:N-acetylglucosaminyl-diphospho-decaprenol L-rhamnosyltransferase